ncbi:MAG TPA: NAD+ synthase [Gemmatimonadota bacterium]|jgi:NAD+ synthase (glutamine-hydrolysing)|nr:NAD+ synthase [Gemmatimonadota bacterium]
MATPPIPFRLALAQIDVVVGDVTGNLERIRATLARAEESVPDLVVFPELAISGYPPEDLLLRPSFLDAAREALDALARDVGDAVVVVGFPEQGADVYNAAAILRQGRVRHVYRKRHLPNYGVFDENRYFRRGESIPVYRLGDVTLAVNICEDIWYPGEPLAVQALAGDARLAINLSASPYHAGKGHDRERMIATRAEDNAIVVAYCNLVGGQDELVFDGQSLIIDEDGELLARGAAFEEDLLLVDLPLQRVLEERLHDPRRRKSEIGGDDAQRVERVDLGERRRSERASLPARAAVDPAPASRPAEILSALTLGLGDYFRKNGFREACLGVSGGIDSAVTAAIAVRALGPERVHGFYLPSRYSSETSRRGARDLCANLGIAYREFPIDGILDAFLGTLEPEFGDLPADTTEENLQARIRGNLLMAFSNKFGWLVLAPGNKSEMSVGYSTLYGDMVGGFAILKDLLKTHVYDVAGEINRQSGRDLIPRETIERAPTAELKLGQRDVDTLPPYGVLDPILEAYVERDLARRDIVALGYDAEVVRWVVDAVDRSEYKRRQAPPGLKITTRAFGKDRRMPITNRFRG